MNSVNTHAVTISPTHLKAGGYVYRVLDRDTGQVWIERSRNPICAVARLLHTLGADDADMIETYAPDAPTARQLFGSVGFFRKLVVREDAKKGPQFEPHKANPFPDS